MPLRTRGFTLVEVMIVVVIVAILAAIALPSYQSQVRKGNRSAAQQVMQEAALKQQQVLLDTRAYAATFAALTVTVPTKVSDNYTLSISTGAANDCKGTAFPAGMPKFVITGQAINSQQPDGDLGNLCVDSNGNKTPNAKWGL